ncbi:unnamed protein product, partial [Iphiclides podalirius]
MAWGEFTFNREGRLRIAAVLRALLIAQLAISLLVVLFCYNASFRVMTLLKQVHKITVYLFYGVIVLQAYCMKLQYTSGLRLISWLLKCPHWPRATEAAKTWLISGTLVALNGLLVYAACRGTLKALMKELSASLRIGIAQYLTETKWKYLMDTMQIELSCCGVERPNDWHDIPWINMDYLNEGSVVVMKLAGTDGKVLPPVSPYSCCTPRVLAACYHDPLQQVFCGCFALALTAEVVELMDWQLLMGQVEWRGAWSAGSPLPSASLHTRGCVEAIRAPLARALLGLQLFIVLVLLLQFVIVILTQLLRTSAIEAVLSGDFDGCGRGWLLGSLSPEERRRIV